MIYLVLKTLGVNVGNRQIFHEPSLLLEDEFYFLLEDGLSTILLET